MANEKDKLDRWRDLDFYGALGIDSSAPAADVKKAFRKVALTCHPDKVPEECRAEATRRFQLIGEAYEVLSSPLQRRSYDRVRPKGNRARGGKERKAEPPPPAAFRADSPLGIGAPCDGCERCVPVRELRKCPRCANLICRRCDACNECPPVAPAKPAAAKPKAQHGPDIFEQNLRGRRGPPPPPRERPAPKPWTGLGASGPEERPDAPRRERPAPKERPDAKQDSQLLTALLAMGFTEEAARAAAARCSTVESAIEFVMAAEAEARNEQPEAADGAGDPADAMADLDVPEREGIPGSPAASPNGRAVHREDDLDRREILLAMGFREEDVEAAMARCSSLDACVEQIMSRMPQTPQRQPKHADVAEPDNVAGGAQAAVSPEEDIIASLVSLGFSEQQARAARRRCSSLEAAVDWIAAHPDAT